MNIGLNIYTLRKEKKITQAQLAEKLGVSEQAISKWENGQCAPDVSLFPVMAEYFGVSIDRLFGYHRNSYADEVKAIIKEADDSMDTYKEIEIVSEGLKRYPNSPDLKNYLAFSLSMVNRISEDENERKEAVQKAIRLCTEVVDTCGNTGKVDKALNTLVRIHNETGNYNEAEACIAKLSADRYDARVVGKVELLGVKGCYAEQIQYGETALWHLWWTMDHVFSIVIGTLLKDKDYQKALRFLEAEETLLSVFDGGCPDFYTCDKLFTCMSKAGAYKSLNEKTRCLQELEKLVRLAEQAKTVEKSKDFNIAVRNPVYFSEISGAIHEQYISDFRLQQALKKYDGFFGEDEAYLRLKESITA